MNTTIPDSDMFAQNIRQATLSLKDNNYDSAYNMIVEAMRADPSAPQPHNLMGIFYELSGDGNMARRHYRAAYSLDPTYKPACSNLERICTDFDNKLPTYDFGEIPEDADAKTAKNKRT